VQADYENAADEAKKARISDFRRRRASTCRNSAREWIRPGPRRQLKWQKLLNFGYWPTPDRVQELKRNPGQ
jgi:hypothetical protein